VFEIVERKIEGEASREKGKTKSRGNGRISVLEK